MHIRPLPNAYTALALPTEAAKSQPVKLKELQGQIAALQQQQRDGGAALNAGDIPSQRIAGEQPNLDLSVSQQAAALTAPTESSGSDGLTGGVSAFATGRLVDVMA